MFAVYVVETGARLCLLVECGIVRAEEPEVLNLRGTYTDESHI